MAKAKTNFVINRQGSTKIGVIGKAQARFDNTKLSKFPFQQPVDLQNRE